MPPHAAQLHTPIAVCTYLLPLGRPVCDVIPIIDRVHEVFSSTLTRAIPLVLSARRRLGGESLWQLGLHLL